MSWFGERRFFWSNLVRIYLPTALCFLVINITNATILLFLGHHGLVYGKDSTPAANLEKTARYFIIPLKSLLFFVGTAVLAAPLVQEIFRSWTKIFTWRFVSTTMLSMFACLILTATVFPLGFGRSYARISTDPFSQDSDQLYRRLLLPGLANLYHLDGFFFAFFFWITVFFTVLVMKQYFLIKNIDLSVLEQISLLTVGVFAASFQSPGYPEIAVLLLGIIALIEFERDGHFSVKQLAAFSLALMAHEACAVIVFAPMIVFLFGRKSWVPNGIVALIYCLAAFANFSFHIAAPVKNQLMISDTPVSVYFWQSPSTVLLAGAFAFKLFWVIVPIAVYHLLQINRRVAYFTISGFALAFASTYIAIDYSRLIAFATVPMIVCLVQARKIISPRLFKALVAINIMVPSFAVNGKGGLVTFRGLYYEAYKLLFKLPSSTF